MSIALELNCGFARVAIYELSAASCRTATSTITVERATEFCKLFHASYEIPSNYFTPGEKSRPSVFDKRCEKVLHSFRKARWRPDESRKGYLDAFATQKWKELPTEDKAKHTLSKCEECRREYTQYQDVFPLKPVYKVEKVVAIPVEMSEKEATIRVLQDANDSFVERKRTATLRSQACIQTDG